MSVPVRPRRVSTTALGDLAGALGDQAGALGDLAGPAAAVTVRGVTHDSRAVENGDLYAALPGASVHGADFAAQAVAGGAAAILTDRAGAATAAAAGVPVLVVDDARAALGPVASRIYGDPSRHLDLYGVTGTNGKTTTAYLLDAGLRAAGATTGLLGTIETRIAGERISSQRTTPEAPELQSLLAVMVERGVTAVAMEVSSHALTLGRVGGCHFRAGIFTNLSQDHLDFHPTMADYFAAKASLFQRTRCDLAVVDTDDEWGSRLAGQLQAGAGSPPLVTVGSAAAAVAAGRPHWRMSPRPGGTVSPGPTAPVSPDPPATVSPRPAGVRLVAEHRPVLDLDVRLAGSFNLANAALAAVALVETGRDAIAVARGIGGLAGVAGRMERVCPDADVLALVDFAHTPDAVTALLAAVRPLTAGRLLVVLGCGGDRDRGKRPLMGAAAASGADVAVFTDDNPRSEASATILAAVAEGARAVPPTERGDVVVVADRAAAIAHAVGLARAGDAVVVAGKGHETGQEVAGTVTPFDDRLVLAQALVASGHAA